MAVMKMKIMLVAVKLQHAGCENFQTHVFWRNEGQP
jgi:hypothetical protein